MSYYFDTIINTILWVRPLIFMVIGIILFIVDGIKAKKKSRLRKISITVMFWISIAIACLYICFLIMIIRFLNSDVAMSNM